MRFVGIELQVDYIAGTVLDLGGRVLARRRIGRSMAELGPARALGVVADVARDLIADARCTPDQVQSLHMAVPGLVDADAGMLSFAPNLHWRDVDIVHTLMGRLQWSDTRIGVDNDANMGAMAHYAVGEVAGTSNLLYLAGAVGVGAGMIVDGRIVRGADGFAGEVGHMTVGQPDRLCGCGRKGCWETEVGLAALLNMVAEPGEPVAGRTDRSRRAAGRGDPARGGRRSAGARRPRRAGELARHRHRHPGQRAQPGHHRARRALSRRSASTWNGPSSPSCARGCWPLPAAMCRVVFSELGFEAASLGAAHVGIEQLISDPTLARLREAS